MTPCIAGCVAAAWDKYEEMRADRDSYVLQVMTLRRKTRQLQEELMAMVAERDARKNNG